MERQVPLEVAGKGRGQKSVSRCGAQGRGLAAVGGWVRTDGDAAPGPLGSPGHFSRLPSSGHLDEVRVPVTGTLRRGQEAEEALGRGVPPRGVWVAGCKRPEGRRRVCCLRWAHRGPLRAFVPGAMAGAQESLASSRLYFELQWDVDWNQFFSLFFFLLF